MERSFADRIIDSLKTIRRHSFSRYFDTIDALATLPMLFSIYTNDAISEWKVKFDLEIHVGIHTFLHCLMHANEVWQKKKSLQRGIHLQSKIYKECHQRIYQRRK